MWRGAYRDLVRKHEGKRPLRRPRCIWEDNIKTSSRIGMGPWTGLIQLRRGTGDRLS